MEQAWYIVESELLSSIGEEKKYITNCSRVIRHAWHFYYALVLVVKVVCGSFGIACLTP
ncbi:DUF3265 domain-containing protein [Vibrio parahaemolyticus]|nr:DUF3265 domain-containing protein [Vibrio parahaemolyticus]